MCRTQRDTGLTQALTSTQRTERVIKQHNETPMVNRWTVIPLGHMPHYTFSQPLNQSDCKHAQS